MILETQAHKCKRTLEDFLCLCLLPKEESCSRCILHSSPEIPSSSRSLGWCWHQGSVTALSWEGGVEEGDFHEDEQTLFPQAFSVKVFSMTSSSQHELEVSVHHLTSSSLITLSFLVPCCKPMLETERMREFVVGFPRGLEQRLSPALPVPSWLCRALLALLPLLGLYFVSW